MVEEQQSSGWICAGGNERRMERRGEKGENAPADSSARRLEKVRYTKVIAEC